MTTTEDARYPYAGIAVSKGTLRQLAIRDTRWSMLKMVLYLASIALPCFVFYQVDDNVIRFACLVFLGIVYAHGLELQHEALHGNLFNSPALNRIAGFLAGAPMLVPFTLYRAYHLHHHRCVGTLRDEELFDYTARSLTNPVSMAVRIWNLVKIPAFLVTFLKLVQGDELDKVKSSDRRALLIESTLLFAMLAAAVVSLSMFDSRWAILWLVPWLVVAEPLHFMVEVPEHIGCDRSSREILKNTRSYTTNPIWAYLTNYNSFHIEHHLFPNVPAHRLRQLHDSVRDAQGHCTEGYWAALREVYGAVRKERAS